MSFRAGYIGLIGQPNSGKSTLLNALVGEKVSIVTSKPQTTRRRMVGLVTTPEYQAILVDSPGVIRAQSGLNRFLEEEYKDVIHQSDALIATLNLDEKSEDKIDLILRLMQESKKPWIAVITKIDLGFEHRVPILEDKLSRLGAKWVKVSALKSAADCRSEIALHLPGLLPESPAALYPEEMYTTATERELSEELIREKCFENLQQEIPFGLAVRIRRFIEGEGQRHTRIDAEILLAKENHKGIVVGAGGSMLKKIGTTARQDIESLLDRPVFLDLQVSARRQWSKNPRLMEELGYVLQTPS